MDGVVHVLQAPGIFRHQRRVEQFMQGGEQIVIHQFGQERRRRQIQ